MVSEVLYTPLLDGRKVGLFLLKVLFNTCLSYPELSVHNDWLQVKLGDGILAWNISYNPIYFLSIAYLSPHLYLSTFLTLASFKFATVHK